VAWWDGEGSDNAINDFDEAILLFGEVRLARRSALLVVCNCGTVNEPRYVMGGISRGHPLPTQSAAEGQSSQ
jgi:hypothetical protein